MNAEEFDDLIQRYRQGRATGEERQLLEKWLEQCGEADLFNRLSEAEKNEIGEEIFFKVARNLRHKQRVLSGKQERPFFHFPVYRRVSRLPLYGVAAAVLVFMLVLYFFSNVNTQPQPVAIQEEVLPDLQVMTSAGSVRKVILADGSIIWLKGYSKLEYPALFTGNERRVSLSGEALFEVAKDSLHPFIITTGTLTARVLGTSFNIKSTAEDVEVIVLTGKVALSSDNEKHDIVVLPNEKAMFSKTDSRLSKTVTLEEEPQQTVRQTEYSMRFNAATIGEIARKIEAKFDVTVSLEGEAIEKCMLTADFTDQSLEATLDMISAVLGFTYEIEAGRVTLRGVSCG